MKYFGLLLSFLNVTYLWLLILPYMFAYLGAASNQLVLIANHDTFPVLMRADAAARVMPMGYDDTGHVLMTSSTHLNALGDIFDFHDGWESVGDILLGVGTRIEDFCTYVWIGLVIAALWRDNTVLRKFEDMLGVESGNIGSR